MKRIAHVVLAAFLLLVLATLAHAATGGAGHAHGHAHGAISQNVLASLHQIEQDLAARNAQLAALQAQQAAVAAARTAQIDAALAGQQALITIQQAALAEELRVKNRPTDFPPPAGGGGFTAYAYGATCEAARARLRWSDLPCAADMPVR
jgi:hypothetical protein